MSSLPHSSTSPSPASEADDNDRSLLHRARGLMRDQQWGDAAQLFDRLIAGDGGLALQRNLAHNLAAMREHRPRLYELLLSAPGNQAYQVAPGKGDQMTIVHHNDSGSTTPLSADYDPATAVKTRVERHRAIIDSPAPIALMGVGDGHLLAHLAMHAPALPLGQQKAVFIIERDFACVLLALTVAPMHGPDGPIEQQRFEWFVGDQWAEQLEARLMDQPTLPLVAHGLHVGLGQKPEEQMLAAVLDSVQKHTRQLQRANFDVYASRDAAALPGRFDTITGLKVLVITTRFSTVLKHAAADAVDGFEKLGCDVRFLIEPEGHHRLTIRSLVGSLREFEPDLVFTIDHLRGEYPDVFPPQLPFACWAQDHLPTLLDAAAGAAMHSHDFLLTSVSPMYTGTYGYGADRCIDLPKLTRVPTILRPRSECPRFDLVYVSHASRDPRDVAGDTLALFAESPDALRIAEATVSRLFARYDAGQSIATLGEMGRLIDDAAEACDLPLIDRDITARNTFVHHFFHPLNDALYRQQALRWVTKVAGEMDLSLGIFGNGWDKQADFAAYAQGPVAYGDELEQLTRDSRINMQIVPYFCLHQRLLDGLSAGGFFLVRQHPTDTLLQEASRFIATHLPDEINTLDAARRCLNGPERAALDELLARGRCLCDLLEPIDPIAWVRSCQRSGLVADGDQTLPHLSEVSFDDAASLRGRIECYLNNDAVRDAVVTAQRSEIIGRLSYEAGLRRTIKSMGQRLADPCMSGSNP